MRFLKSIRWRFQLWYGLLFAAMLCGFGCAAWQMEKASRLQKIDEELHQRISILMAELRPADPPHRQQNGRPPPPDDPLELGPAGRENGRYGPGRGGPPPGQNGYGPPPAGSGPSGRLTLRLTPSENALFNGASGNEGYYYVVWLRNGPGMNKSVGAPDGVPQPEEGQETPRQRGPYKEAFFFTAPGDCLLVGRSIESDLASLNRLGWLFLGVGAGVLVFGLAGGWWLTTHALRPIEDISRTATEIAQGDLSRRINTSQTQSELGQLATVLNDTFARLDAAFAQQTRFTSDAAHELRTPVTVVLTQTQIALARERSPEDYRDTLEACQRAAQRMRRLTESLLELARLDAGREPMRRASFDLSHTADDCLDLVRPLAEQRNITLHADLPKTICQGDPERLSQVITNLLANAIHYNHEGGEVHVSLRADEQDTLLVVADTGAGIASADLPHVFERFYRADKSRTTQNHTGLGLAISKAIVEAHHGSIEVFSEEGRGSAFTVRLPVNGFGLSVNRNSANGASQ
jgi:signal transduction histidine kinase